MTAPLVLPAKVLAIYRCLKSTAEKGEECPCNGFLAVVGGYGNRKGAIAAVALLEATGAIDVVRYAKTRVITVHEVGKSTKAVNGQPVRYLPNRKRERIAA